MNIAQQCFEEGLTPGHTACRLDGSFAGMQRPDQKVGRTIPFARVPQQTLDETWAPLIPGRWSFEDHITLGGDRAVIRLLELFVQDPRNHRWRVLSLQDNRPVSGSFSKGRSTAPGLNRLCRKRAALTVAGQIQLHLPWVQSVVMPADGLSRIKNSVDIPDEFHGHVSDLNEAYVKPRV